MTGPTTRRLLAAVVLVLAFVSTGSLSPARASGPALSPQCATLHAGEGGTLSSSTGSISISGPFATGEQVRFTVTASAPSIKVTAPSGVKTLTPASGEPVRYDVLANSIHQFTITGGGGPVTLTVACGFAPTITGTEDASYFVKDAATSDAACVGQTNAVATCAVGTIDTSSAGSGTYAVTATDTSGLQSTRTFHYT